LPLPSHPYGAHRLLSHQDYYIRLQEAQLEQVEFAHLATTVEPELLEADPVGRDCKGCLTGATEWFGAVDHTAVSIGWDWISLNDLAISILDPLHIRTNVMLIDHWGVDLGDEITGARILAQLAKLGWQRTVRQNIATHSQLISN
jgi:Domain of unknown function (DUF4902)